MESFTHESDDSSSCTQSDADSTNSSNGTNPFLLCARGNSLHSGGHGRLHDSAEDIRPYKLHRVDPSEQLHYHASALTNSQAVSTTPYGRNVVGEIYGGDGIHRSSLLSQGRSYTSSTLEDCRDLPSDFVASSGRFQHARLPYIGNTPGSTLLLPMGCKVDKMPINFGNNAGNFYLGLTDPQPGRCRRTDGKKWRCGRAVVPEQKYCERHMHRGRGRSKAAKLAKITTTIDTNQSNQPHGSGRALNQPLIQLLSQLSVPVQPVNKHPETGQHPTSAVQPLTWLQKSAQTFQHPTPPLPYVAQPLLAEHLNQFPVQSRSPDWPVNQLPMQAEPLNFGQSNGRPAVLAQAIPMNAVTDVKVSPDCCTGLAISESSRVHSNDPIDVLTLDVQGIKRLLENAPCSRRSSIFSSKPKQLPNVADMLNVAHLGNLNIEPRKPPSLMDVLKMVDPFTSSMRTCASSVFHHHPSITPQGSVVMPTNICQPGLDLPETVQSGTHLSLTFSDEATPEKQKRHCLPNLQSSSDLATMQNHNDMKPIQLFKATHEGQPNTRGECLQHFAQDLYKISLPNSTEACVGRHGNRILHTSESASAGQLVSETSKTSGEILVNAEKICLNFMEERSRSAVYLNKGITSREKGDFKSAAGSSCQKNSANVDINSSTHADWGSQQPRSLVEGNRSSLRKVSSKYHESSPKSNSESLILLEGSLDVCDSSGKSEGICPTLTGKSLDQHVAVDSSDMNSPVSLNKRPNRRESYTKLDMNIPVLAVKDEHQPGNSELGKASPSSTLPIENLQTKAAPESLSSGSSCNTSSLSKSTLSLDPASVSNAEPSPHVSPN